MEVPAGGSARTRRGPATLPVVDGSVLVAALVGSGSDDRWAVALAADGDLAGPELTDGVTGGRQVGVEDRRRKLHDIMQWHERRQERWKELEALLQADELSDEQRERREELFELLRASDEEQVVVKLTSRLKREDVGAAVELLRFKFGTMFDFPPPGIVDKEFERANPDHPVAAPQRGIRIRAADVIHRAVASGTLSVTGAILARLHEAAFDRCAAVRLEIVRALGKAGRAESVAVLERLLAVEDEDSWVRSAATASIEKINNGGSRTVSEEFVRSAGPAAIDFDETELTGPIPKNQ